MSFEVIPAGIPATTQDWQAAMKLPASELPSLSDEQIRHIQKFGINREQYVRLQVLLPKYAREREAEQGRKLGEILEEILAPASSQVCLSSVSRRGSPSGWRVEIQKQVGGSAVFSVSLEDVAALSEGAVSPEEMRRLREGVWSLLELSSAAAVAS